MNTLTSVVNIDAVKRMFKYGHQLLQLNDLDPVYVAYWKAFERGILTKQQLNQSIWWYSYTYHTGSVCQIIESMDQYKFVKKRISQVKADKKNKVKGVETFWGLDRGRPGGAGGLKVVEDIQRSFPKPEQIVNTFSLYPTCKDVTQALCQFNSFSDWTGWKFSDMIERLDFKTGLAFKPTDLYNAPKEIIKKLFGTYKIALEYMTEEFGECLAPPRYERKCNLQEFETIWCKCKGEKLEDREKMRKELYSRGKLADQLFELVPK